jgi:hypothetical protein
MNLEAHSKLPNKITYYLHMFFELNFLIILTRMQKMAFCYYCIDNHQDIVVIPNMDLYSRMMFFVGIAIILMFFALGAFVLFSPTMSYIPKNYKVIFSIFIFGYGFFRLIGSYQKFKKSREDDL